MGAYIATLTGEYDIANQRSLRQQLGRLESCVDLVLDLSQVTYLDSTFISELILFTRDRSMLGFGPPTLVAPSNSTIRRVLTVAGVPKLMRVVDRAP